MAIQTGGSAEPEPPAQLVDVFVLSPADVQAERDAVDEVAKDISHSRRFSNLNLALRVWRWENLTGDVGRTAQEITNEAYLDEPMWIYVGIVWRKLGSATGASDSTGRPYESGTLEEFDRVLRFKRASGTTWPRILFYRGVGGGMPTNTSEIAEIARVATFFDQFKADGEHPGRYFEFDSTETFRRRLDQDLRNVLEELHEELGEGSRSARGGASTGSSAQPTAVPADWEPTYLTALREELERIRVPLPRSGAGHTRLEAVYVPLNLHSAYAPHAEPVIWTRLLTPKRVVVTGGAGCGKSTLLRHTALKVIDSRQARLTGGSVAGTPGADGPPGIARVPIWLDLTDVAARFARTAADEPSDWERWLPVLASATSLTEPQVRELLHTGEVVAFFDKLDEVADPAQRDFIARGIERLQVLSSPLGMANHVIVGCRSRALEGAGWADDFEEIGIRPMDGATRARFLQSWCGEMWGADASASLRSVLEGVRRSLALAELSGSPQVATMLASLAAEGPLPMQRVQLYDRFVTTMVSTERVRRHGAPAVIREHLVSLAQSMQTNREPGVLGMAQSRELVAKGGGSPELVDDLVLHTGLLAIDRKLGASDIGAVVRFEHRSIQEFLAACHFAVGWDALLDHVLDAAWTDTIAMTAGILALGSPDQLPEFLAAMVGEPEPASGTDALVEWAPRVAVAGACLAEVGPLGIDEAHMEPARSAQSRVLPALRRLEVRTRVSVAEGLGSVRDPRLTPEARYVDIPGGSFWRGSEDSDAWEQERPATAVELSSFRIQRWPVTVAEFRQFLRTGRGYELSTWWPPDGWELRRQLEIEAPLGWDHQEPRGNRPVTGVSWWEASAYCTWLSSEGDVPAGWRAELPTEAQWERTARGPATGVVPLRRFPWGDEWGCEGDMPANHLDTHAGICPVGLFACDVSPDGAWDLAGNVAERCRDGFAAYDATSRLDPLNTDYRHGHVVRGGDWASPPLDLRVTARFGDSRDARDDRTGFRIVLTATGST